VFFRFFDRTPISRNRDCYGLAGNSKISGGCQVFGLHQRFDNFEHSGLVQTDGTEREESLPIKAGHWRTILHLATTCTRFNTSARRRTCSLAGPERSHQLQIPPSLNSKAILQRVRLLFLLRQHFSRRQYFSRRQVFSICLIFWMRQGFSICLIFWMRQVFSIRLIFWMRQVFSICLIFWIRQVFSIYQCFCQAPMFSDAPMFLYIICGAYIFVYFSAFLFSMRQ
jgi:hypothetical protein